MSEKMDILDIYKDEEQKSLINRKKKLILNLKKIAKTLKQNETIDSFLHNRINAKKRFSSLNIDAKKNQLFVWICVKICGTIFFSFFLISILQLMGIMSSIEKEIKFAFKSYFGNKRKKEDENDFYNNYLKTNTQPPIYSLFFLSSLLSNILNKLIGFCFTTILMIFC